METAETIPLGLALHILSSVHTRDDDLVGFTVMSHAGPEYSRWTQSEYIEAWKSVRHNIGLPVAAAHDRTETAQNETPQPSPTENKAAV